MKIHAMTKENGDDDFKYQECHALLSSLIAPGHEFEAHERDVRKQDKKIEFWATTRRKVVAKQQLDEDNEISFNQKFVSFRSQYV